MRPKGVAARGGSASSDALKNGKVGCANIAGQAHRGATIQAVLMSVYRTLKLRSLDPTKTIADALRTYLATGQLPPLTDTNIANG